MNRLSGMQRLALVVSVAWIGGAYILFEVHEYEFPYGQWMPFLLFGFGPVVVPACWIWIKAGFAPERSEVGLLDRSYRRTIADRLRVGHQIDVKSFALDSTNTYHVVHIRRNDESGVILFSRAFIRDHTPARVHDRLSSQETQVQLQAFNGKQLTIKDDAVQVQIITRGAA